MSEKTTLEAFFEDSNKSKIASLESQLREKEEEIKHLNEMLDHRNNVMIPELHRELSETMKELRDKYDLIERLKTTLVAGAELIKENWDKLVDEEGYGPQNLLLRMDGTLNSSGYPGYSAGEFKSLMDKVSILEIHRNDFRSLANDRKEECEEKDKEIQSLKKESFKLRDMVEARESEVHRVCGELAKAIEQIKVDDIQYRSQLNYVNVKNDELREALKGIINSCDPENPSHENIWRIAYGFIGQMP